MLYIVVPNGPFNKNPVYKLPIINMSLKGKYIRTDVLIDCWFKVAIIKYYSLKTKLSFSTPKKDATKNSCGWRQSKTTQEWISLLHTMQFQLGGVKNLYFPISITSFTLFNAKPLCTKLVTLSAKLKDLQRVSI